MHYAINEGQFTLPSQYEDDSITVLKFPKLQASFVVTRAQLKEKQTADDYFNDQLVILKQSMKGFIIDKRTSVTFGKEGQLTGFETHCEFDKNGFKMHQYLLVTQNEQRLTVFTYSQPRPFSPEDMKHWQTIKAGFIPAVAT